MMFRRLLIFAVATVLCAGCEKETTAPTPSAPAQTATQAAAQGAPEPPPVEKIELTLALQPHEASDKPAAEVEKLTSFLVEQTGYELAVMVPSSHGDAMDAMRKGKAQITVLPGWAYLKAHMSADADLLLAETLDGKPGYGSRWYRAKDAKIEKLSDLRGKRVAFTAPSSPEGFLLPYAQLVREDVVKQGEDLNKAFKDVFFAGTDEAALETLVQGKADAAAASDRAYDEGLTDEAKAKVEVLAEAGTVPSRVFAVRADMKMEVRDKLKAALLELNKPENKALLQSTLGMEGLTERSHGDHVTGLAEAQELVGTEFPIEQPADDAPTK